MKIGILSVNTHTKGLNFACPVHTYAFQQFLSQHGFESVVIDYKANYYDNFNPLHPVEYYSEKYDLLMAKEAATPEEQQQLDRKRRKTRRLRDGYTALYREREIRYEKFESFIRRYYTITDFCYDPDLLEILDPGCDCYVCATDVVWKKQPEGFDRGYFLASACMENKWKIAYAASRGIPKPYTDDEKALFFHYLSDIDEISVREASLKQYIEENSDLKARVVIDPVLFHDRAFYERISVKPAEEHYILLYYAEERSKNTLLRAVDCARATGLKIVELTNLPIQDGLLSKYGDIEHVFHYDVGPDEWIGFIQHADYVFTNSFHTCCFSIIFGRKFYVGSRHGDKLMNFLGSLELEHRILPETDETAGPAAAVQHPGRLARLRKAVAGRLGLLPRPEAPAKPAFDYGAEIDFERVERLLAPRREESIAFLLSALHACEGQTRAPRDYETYKRSLTYRILYNACAQASALSWDYQAKDGTVCTTPGGSCEFTPADSVAVNDGTTRLLRNGFALADRRFLGWRLRLRIDARWFWCLEDGRLRPQEFSDEAGVPVRLFKDEDVVPYFPVNRIAVMVAEAVWEDPDRPQI